MRKLIKGKEEIIYLLSKAIDHYKLETGQEIVQNTNRKNYEALAIVLSAISNQLPLKLQNGAPMSTAPTATSGKRNTLTENMILPAGRSRMP
jgi:hypothetical protein